VPQYSIKLCTYDPTIIDAFERLRKNRKQAAFTHEALKYFFSTEKGGQVLLLMEGNTSRQPITADSLSTESPCIEKSTDRIVANSNSVFVQQSDSSTVLDCIMK
jgi:hypothetical protein